jgi:hypothetical protein
MDKSRMLSLVGALIDFHRAGVTRDRTLFDRSMIFEAGQLHDGLSVDDFWSRHVAVMGRFSKVFGAQDFSVEVLGVIENFSRGLSLVEYVVRSSLGKFLWLETTYFDESGVLRPNGSLFECVDKLCFSFVGADAKPVGVSRSVGMLVRPHVPKAVFVLPDLPLVESQLYLPPAEACRGGDARANVIFKLEGDDYKSRTATFKVAVEGKPLETRKLRLRGVDHPYFCDQKPVVSGRSVSLMAGHQSPFTLRVGLVGGDSHVIEQPAKDFYEFTSDIEVCHLTDALCMDWIWVRDSEVAANAVEGIVRGDFA